MMYGWTGWADAVTGPVDRRRQMCDPFRILKGNNETEAETKE